MWGRRSHSEPACEDDGSHRRARLVHASGISPHSGGPGPRLPSPGIRSRATSMLSDAVHRQTRPGLRRVMHRNSGHVYSRYPGRCRPGGFHSPTSRSARRRSPPSPTLPLRLAQHGAADGGARGAFAAYIGTEHAIAVTNGTAALHLICLAAGLGPGDEVIVPSLTFVATVNAIATRARRPSSPTSERWSEPWLVGRAVAAAITRARGDHE